MQKKKQILSDLLYKLISTSVDKEPIKTPRQIVTRSFYEDMRILFAQATYLGKPINANPKKIIFERSIFFKR